MSERPKDNHIGFDCSSPLKERVRRAASEEDRTLSGWVRHILRRTLDARRRLREDEDVLQTP